MDNTVMNEQDGQSCSEVDYMKDIEEIQFASSSDEDDDEPRLRIDTSEEDDAPDVTSSKGNSDKKDAATNAKKLNARNTNPLQSLQQLVHSPFLNAQISVADGGVNQGCKTNPLLRENRSRSRSDARYSDSSRSSSVEMRSNNNGAIYDAISVTRPNVGNPRSKKVKRNANFQRLSPVSIEVVPSLSHLLPLSQQSPPLPASPPSEKSDKTSSRLNYIVNKLQKSATEEEHLRQLQKLQLSPEGVNFKMFQQFLKSGQFQARCSSNNLEILPANTNTISLKNSKGFRYNSSNATTQSTFGSGAMPSLKFKSDFNPSTRKDFRMPPALTVIPKQTGVGTKKSNFRRSPPPMVPIESIANFRKPLNEDNVVYRLKKLGTDIELEKSSTRDDSLVIEEVKSVTSDKTSLPFLKPIPIEERSSDLKSNLLLTKLHPPPPSLIPLKSSAQYVPMLPNYAAVQSSITEVPIRSKKSSSNFVSILPKTSALQSDPSDGFYAPDVIITRKEEGELPAVMMNAPMLQFSKIRLPPNKVTKRKKRNRLSAKSEYTKLAHALVQAATPLNVPTKKDDIPVIVPIRNEAPAKESQTIADKEVTIEPIQTPARVDNTPTNVDSVASTSNQANTTDKYFVFSPNQAVTVAVLQGGRKMLSCDICSGVYHKMFSLKKHYYKNHINPLLVSPKHTTMFSVSAATPALLANSKKTTATYWCSKCECVFDEKTELVSHLTDHPPMTLETGAKSSRLYVCNTCKMVFSKKRVQIKHSKKCVKTNPTEKPKEVADEFQDENVADETNSTSSKNDDILELDELSKNSKLETSMMCLFCELSFTDTTKRKKHVLQHHHPKRKQQPCAYCKNKTFSDLSDLLKHICEMHSKRYFGCAICKIRFRTKEDLVAHNAESHDGNVDVPEKELVIDEKAKGSISNKNGKNYKCNQCPKVFINTVELGRHRKAAHRDTSRNNIKKVVSAFSASIDTNEQKYRSTIITTADYETEFYKNVSNNVKHNLEHFMEGRLEMKKEENPTQDADNTQYADLQLDVVKEPTPPLNFQEMYGTNDIDSRFIQNVSRLHLATQLTILKKANLLDTNELNCTLRTTSSDRNSTIASRLALAEKQDGEKVDDEGKGENDAASEVVFSGEWIKPRNYICGTCFARFNNFWDMEDHRWSRHPNVYGFYYEFVTEQAPGPNWAMKRVLQGKGVLGLQANPSIPPSSTCTKCNKVITPISEFHKHILECGGDTTWTSMMFAAHTKRNKKWRPYGSRRRKNIARHRGLKRNIPTTPVKIIGPPRNRQKAGDTETIQRMIANLPPKRITRRVITFDDLDAKPKRVGNNQSSVLTRKRRENLDARASRSSQQETKQNTSKTLLGTKNNTPFNNSSPKTSQQAAKNTNKAQADAKPKTIEEPESAKAPVVSVQENAIVKPKPEPELVTSTEVVHAQDEIKEEHVSEPETNSEVPSKAASDENTAIEPETSPETSQETQIQTQVESEPIPEPEQIQCKTESKVLEEKTITEVVQPKSETLPEPEPIQDFSDVISKSTESSDVADIKTETEAKSTSDAVPIAQPSLSTEPKNKPLIIKIQNESRQRTESKGSLSDQPVTIIRSDKKKKKRCTPVTSKRLAETKPVPVKESAPVALKKSEMKPIQVKESAQVAFKKSETKPVQVKESAQVASKNSETKLVQVKGSAQVASKNSETKPVQVKGSAPVSLKKLETKPVQIKESAPVASKKSDPKPAQVKESAPVASKKLELKPVQIKESAPVASKKSELKPVQVKESALVASKKSETKPVQVKETSPVAAKKPETKTIPIKESSLVASKNSSTEPLPMTEDIPTKKSPEPVPVKETKDESVSTEALQIKTEIKLESAEIPKAKTETISCQTDDIDKPIGEAEEGEIDLSTIEPADEDSPQLPDTSVILAAMKETMRQTDAVISTLPMNVSGAKKRKRDEAGKCKKCGIKIETGNSTMCENCVETPSKKLKPLPVPVPKVESFVCKICRINVPGKLRNDEMCDKCVLIKNDKSPPKKSIPKMKDTRITVPPPPPPFRCRKCDSIGIAPLDGSLFCGKCSRLHETICLLCKSSFISDTDDKVCGKCMLAGSSKQKKRNIENEPVIVTNPVICGDNKENASDGTKKAKCDSCKSSAKCTCVKRRSSMQLDRSSAEVACDNCGKLWKDEENSGSSTCRLCRQVFENKAKMAFKTDARRRSGSSEADQYTRCIECGLFIPTSDPTLKKLCEGCCNRKPERRSSNESRYGDMSSPIRSNANLQRSPKVFSGFASVDEPKIDFSKDDDKPNPPSEHDTPMKFVKLICRGCYGVFDTVSSYKFHCDNCKHRSNNNNEKKPLLRFANRTTEAGTESAPQPEPNTSGASFEILEGVQIKYVKMAGASQATKTEANKDTLVVYESDSSPMKKSDASRAHKKIKRTHSSPETIMDTIESVIRNVCYSELDTISSSDQQDKIPVKDTEEVSDEVALKSNDAPEPIPQPDVHDPKPESETKTETKKPRNSKVTRSKSSKKKRPAKKAKKSEPTEQTVKDDSTETPANAVRNDNTEVEQAEEETEPESSKSKKPSTSRQSDDSNLAGSSEMTLRRTRRRTGPPVVPPGRTLRSRTKLFESYAEWNCYDDDRSDMEFMDIDDDIERSTSRSRKRRNAGAKGEAKKLKTESNNDLGFAVNKTSKTVTDNAASEAAVDDEPTSAEDGKSLSTEGSSTQSSSSIQWYCPECGETFETCKIRNEHLIAAHVPGKLASKDSTGKVTDSEPIGMAKPSDESCDNIHKDVASDATTEDKTKKYDNLSEDEHDIDKMADLKTTLARKMNSATSRRSSEHSTTDDSDFASKYNSPLNTPKERSRRNSAAGMDSNPFFDETRATENSSEVANVAKNVSSSRKFDELNGNLYSDVDVAEDAGHNASSWYDNAWELLDNKSLGSILDTVNELLSRPEVSSCSSDSVDSFREEMMMFQHFGREMSAIEKQEEESMKQDEEPTTITDLDEISGKSGKNRRKAEVKTELNADGLNVSGNGEECEICDQIFTEAGAYQNHMSTVHGNEVTGKIFKDSKFKSNKSIPNGMKTSMKHRCNHCSKVLQSKAETLMHMKEHWKSFALNKSDKGSHLKNSIADKLEELLLDKALINYLKSPQETQHRNNLPLKILNQISLAKKNQFSNWKTALAQMLDMDSNVPPAIETVSVPVPAVEQAPVVETKPAEKTKSQSELASTESSNADPIDGYPCPMCNRTFQYTRLRNTHLIMVHAPRQSTHKHLMDKINDSKIVEMVKSSNESCDNNVRKDVASEKVFHSYLMNDSVNTVVKKESLDDLLPSTKNHVSSTNVGSSIDAKKSEKRSAAAKCEQSAAASTSTKTVKSSNATASGKQTKDEDQPVAKKKKPCRKKMSKKEMNLPAAIVKMKAEQALLQLCNSRFNRICTQ